MRTAEAICTERYTDVHYRQFSQSRRMQFAMKIAGMLTWPVVIPLAYLARRSDLLFRTCSELMSVIPWIFGVIFRSEYYRRTLTEMGSNVFVGFGTIFLYRDVRIGSHVLIGNYSIVHHCDFGSWVLTADHCQFLSGQQYHNFSRTDLPMALQGGRLRRITVGDDCWIGAGAIIMNDVRSGSVVGAGSVVTRPVENLTVVAGNPARLLRRREPSADIRNTHGKSAHDHMAPAPRRTAVVVSQNHLLNIQETRDECLVSD